MSSNAKRAPFMKWAKDTWQARLFVTRIVYKGELAVLCPQLADDSRISVQEYEEPWRDRQVYTVVDDVVPEITWIAVTVDRPLLVEIDQTGQPRFRFLLIPDAPEVRDEHGALQPSDSQATCLAIARTRQIVGCNAARARALLKIEDPEALKIYELAALLFTKNNSRTVDAVRTLGDLWVCSAEQLTMLLPEHLHALATDDLDRREVIRAKLVECLRTMGSWRTEP